MSRIKLKCGGRRRHKAFFGADGAITAAATIAAAGITAAATAKSAKDQAKAIEQSATIQSNALLQQNENANTLQKEQLAFTRAENQENRQQQQDIQATLQMMAGQQNMNDIMNANRQQVKYGGKERKKLKSQPSYGGGRRSFKVIDGGDVVPIKQYPEGTLYEAIGDDHEHYHKTPSGKYKAGVGIKLKNGNVIELEGNQKKGKKGEYLFETPYDLLAISKHDINGYNPSKAVDEGVHPLIAANTQEIIKDVNGYNDDGTKAKYGKRSLKKCGGRSKAKFGDQLKKFWKDYAGASYNAIGNLVGAGITALGNASAGRTMSRAYLRAGELNKNAYANMKGVDMSLLNRRDYEAPHTLAVVTNPNTNINPQLQNIERIADSQKRAINRETLSSAARLTRMAETDDRRIQKVNEQYAYKQNTDDQIIQSNAERITQTAQANADRDAQARQAYANQYLSLLQYNNQIDNAKIAGMAQAEADALVQSAGAKANASQLNMQGFATAMTNGIGGFTSVYDGLRKTDRDRTNLLMGVDNEQLVNYLVQNPDVYGNKARAVNQIKAWKETDNEKLKEYIRQLQEIYGII